MSSRPGRAQQSRCLFRNTRLPFCSLELRTTMPSSRPLQFDLVAAAHAAMIEHGFQPDFPTGVEAELAAIQSSSNLPSPSAGFEDLRSLLWSSIDNDTSKDLDQI